jgi:hypothetical protein
VPLSARGTVKTVGTPVLLFSARPLRAGVTCLAAQGQTGHSSGMRSIAGVVLLVVGLLVGVWGVAVFALLTRSPDSDWTNGATYAAPFVLGGLLGLTAGVQLLRNSE